MSQKEKEQEILTNLQNCKDLKYKYFLFLKCAFEGINHKKIVQKIFRKCIHSPLVLNYFPRVNRYLKVNAELEDYNFLAEQYQLLGQITYLKWNIGDLEEKLENIPIITQFSHNLLYLNRLSLHLNGMIELPINPYNIKIISKCLSMFSFLSHLKIKLIEVDLSQNPENLEYLAKSLSKLKQLKTLILELSLDFLDQNPNILRIFSENFTCRSLIQLDLDLSDNELAIDKTNFHSLSKILSKESLPNLSELKLSLMSSGFNENIESFQILCQTLKKMDYLKELNLNLYDNHLGKNSNFEYMKHLKDALFKKTNLQKLGLQFSQNRLGSCPEQLQILGNTISSLTNLRSLSIDLVSNLLNNSIIFLLDGIKTLVNLTHLDFKFNLNNSLWKDNNVIKSLSDCLSNLVNLNILKLQHDQTDFFQQNDENINDLALAIQKLTNLNHLELQLSINNQNKKEKDLEQLAEVILNFCNKKDVYLKLNHTPFKPTNIDQIIQRF